MVPLTENIRLRKGIRDSLRALVSLDIDGELSETQAVEGHLLSCHASGAQVHKSAPAVDNVHDHTQLPFLRAVVHQGHATNLYDSRVDLCGEYHGAALFYIHYLCKYFCRNSVKWPRSFASASGRDRRKSASSG